MTDGIAAVQARISQIQSLFATPPLQAQAPAAAGAPSSFADALASATGDTSGTDGSGTFATSGAGAPGPAGAVAGGGSGREQAAVAQARKYLGIPYVWGGTDPTKGLDCSGLTQLIYKNLGIDIPRVSYEQATAGRPVSSVAQARPGDLVFYDYSSSRPGIDHVAIYIGNGKIIEAPKPGDVVKINDVGNPTTIRRILPPEAAPRAGAAGVSAGGGPVPAGLAGVPYANLFAAAGARHGVPAALLAAVAKTESAFNPNAVSPAGARGLMQFMPGTASDLGINPLVPAQAVDGAARYLSAHLREFGSVEKALAAYNAGPGTVRRYGGVPPYAETQSYVRKVTEAWGTYR